MKLQALVPSALALALLASGMFPAQAESPISARAPSMAKVGQQVIISGSGFAKGTLVTLEITGPKKGVAKAAALADADGNITYTMVPTAPGAWQVQLLDANGANRAQVKLQAAP